MFDPQCACEHKKLEHGVLPVNIIPLRMSTITRVNFKDLKCTNNKCNCPGFLPKNNINEH